MGPGQRGEARHGPLLSVDKVLSLAVVPVEVPPAETVPDEEPPRELNGEGEGLDEEVPLPGPWVLEHVLLHGRLWMSLPFGSHVVPSQL